MVQIHDTTFDFQGGMIARGILPMRFDDRADADAFLQRYLARVFAGGTSGYQAEDDSWWGCDDTAHVELHRYTIEFGPLTPDSDQVARVMSWKIRRH